MTVSYENYRRQALHQIDNLAKPPGSLGLLEKQAKQILLAWGTFHRELPFGLPEQHFSLASTSGVWPSRGPSSVSTVTMPSA